MSFTNESSAVAAQSNPQPTPYRNAGFRANSIAAAPAVSAQKPVYQTKEWMPWSLLAGGTVIVLYSLSARNDGPAV